MSMDDPCAYVVRNEQKQSVALVLDRQQAKWMCFLLGPGHHFWTVTFRRLLTYLRDMEEKRDKGLDKSP